MAQTKPWDHSMEFNRREKPNRVPILTPVEARQGLISGRVVLILVISLMLAVIAGATTYVQHPGIVREQRF